MDKFKLSSILREAKNTIQIKKTEDPKYSYKKELKRQQLNGRGEKDESGVQKQLVEYF